MKSNLLALRNPFFLLKMTKINAWLETSSVITDALQRDSSLWEHYFLLRFSEVRVLMSQPSFSGYFFF